MGRVRKAGRREADLALAQSPEADWFRLLHTFAWEDYRELGARYYEALFQFNADFRRGCLSLILDTA